MKGFFRMIVDPSMVTSEQVKAARALLRLDQQKLAELVGVSASTIKRLEAKPGPLRCTYETASRLKATLQEQGIVFLEGGVTLNAPGEGA